MTAEHEEHREFIRVPFNTVVEVEVAGRTIRSAEGINISLKGLHLATTEPAPPAGSPCTARIILSGAQEGVVIAADGTVVRAGAGNLSVEFTRLDYDGYHHLRNLILYNSTNPERAEREFEAHWGIRRPHG